MDLAAAQGSDKTFRCERAAKDIPLASPRCSTPTAYCKWRTACPVNALEKERARAG